jgi:hypothetical protein
MDKVLKRVSLKLKKTLFLKAKKSQMRYTFGFFEYKRKINYLVNANNFNIKNKVSIRWYNSTGTVSAIT